MRWSFLCRLNRCFQIARNQRRLLSIFVLCCFVVFIIVSFVYHEYQFVGYLDMTKDVDLSRGNLTGVNRLACGVVTRPGYFHTRTKAVIDTWAKRCDHFHFFYSEGPSNKQAVLGGVALPIKDSRDTLTDKTQALFRYLYTNYKNDVDWFYKCDDDTYVIVENLKFILSHFDPDKPYYLGRRFVIHNGVYGYNSGGAGYALSREATRRLVEEGPRHAYCAQEGDVEDIDIGRCMRALKVTIVDGVDAQGEPMFYYRTPEELIGWHLSHAQRLSKDTATFHYVKPYEMYMYDFMIYGLCRHEGCKDKTKSRHNKGPEKGL